MLLACLHNVWLTSKYGRVRFPVALWRKQNLTKQLSLASWHVYWKRTNQAAWHVSSWPYNAPKRRHSRERGTKSKSKPVVGHYTLEFLTKIGYSISNCIYRVTNWNTGKMRFIKALSWSWLNFKYGLNKSVWRLCDFKYHDVWRRTYM